ncbi:hypothetical protein MMC24_005785 [Lignoscripta atroalba]|nr:hypothetical protein [Lignoscripta atroalba]
MEGCLDILTNIISTVLGDSQEHVSLDLRPGNENSLKPDQAWMKATSVQIKLKLANVTRMRYHERPEVQEALFRMCMRILHDCRHSLSESASLMIETSIIICSQNIVDGAPAKISAIQKFVGADGVLLDALKASMHDWVVALPRVLQSNSELGKERSIAQISAAIEILTNLNVDFDSLDDTMASSLRESVTTIIDASSTKAITSAAEEGLETSMLLQATPSRNTPSDFASILSGGGSCDGLIGRLQKVVSIIGHSRSASSFKRRLVENIKIRNKSRDVDLASLWISFKLLDDTPYEVVEVDSYLSLPVDVQDTHQEFLEVVYSSCVEVLTDSAREDDSDWRLQALALEVLAFQSRQQRLAFRPELVEVLYPVVERMGSNNALLREHAMTCLNIMAKACQYISSADLVTNNVDYLVNAVALKFNTFDISPQAPRVLLMMVRLCGPALIPYLDDLVESIFSALACFHGYPRLVESMFATLSAIVDEGNQLSSSSIKAQPETVHRKLGHHHATISDVATLLKQMTVQSPPAGNPDIDLSSDDQQFDRPTETHGDKPEQDLQGRETSTSDEEVEKKAPSKTYAMVQSIARLGQHYLTHDSPSLRRQLLQLTRRACTALYRNEDEFLPLVNDLWPVVVKRLYDSEPFVSIAATEAVSQIFQSAGDFMASRVDAEWSDIHNLYWGVHLRLKADKKGNGRGEFTSAYQMWDALVKMLISMIEFVWISDEIEDDLVDMLGLYISTRSDVRKALLILNPDAVWLELERQRQVQGGESLKLPGMRGIIFRKVVL